MNEFVNDFDSNAMTVIAKHFDNLSFSIRDTLGNVMYGLSHCQFMLKIVTIDTAQSYVHRHLSDINENLRTLMQTTAVQYMKNGEVSDDEGLP
jgi:hypothetical protein